VACIAAVVNVDRSIDLPFVFGGDGATFAVLDGLRERVIPALREAQRLARESFDLLLRVGLVPVSELLGAGLPVRLAKVRLSPNVTQPTFCGRGWDEAERMVKDPLAHGVLRVREEEGPREGIFEGFECRWQSVPSFRDYKLALPVRLSRRRAPQRPAVLRHAQVERSALDLHRALVQRKPRALRRRQ
jgi:hypothetical protein